MELMENGYFHSFAAKGNGKFLFVFCKRKTELYFPWSVIDDNKVAVYK